MDKDLNFEDLKGQLNHNRGGQIAPEFTMKLFFKNSMQQLMIFNGRSFSFSTSIGVCSICVLAAVVIFNNVQLAKAED